MKELHKILEGRLSLNGESNDFTFGTISEDNGRIKVEAYFPPKDNSILDKYWFNNNNPNSGNIEINCKTTDGNQIYLDWLAPVHFSSSETAVKAKFICYGKMTFEKPLLEGLKEEEVEKIVFIELEGLKLNHTEITQKRVIRANSNRNRDLETEDWDKDYSTFMVNLIDKSSFLTHYGEFYNHPDPKNNNIILEFKKYVSKEIFGYNQKHLINFLSFINGGEVRVRKVYRGNFFSRSENNLSSQIEDTYSFTKIVDSYPSDYLPINGLGYRNSSILGTIFLRYQNFVKECKELDFQSTIYYLNRSNLNDNIEQRVFTLIVALEELGTRQRKLHTAATKTVISKSDFEPIKLALKNTLKQFKSIIPNNNNEYNNLLSKLCDINNQKRDTEEKFYELFDYAGISRTASITSLVKQRHMVVHEGNIGNSLKDKWDLYFQIDQLLRDIILNRIGYRGVRNPRKIKIV